MRERLVSSGVLTEAEDEAIADAARGEVDDATDRAEAAPLPDPATFGDHVYGAEAGRG